MGIDPRFLPDHIKARMEPTDKARETKRVGRRPMRTTAETINDGLLRLERQDHADFAGYLQLKNIQYEHDDPTKRSSNRKGWPDFRCFCPPKRVLFVEFKRGRNQLTPEQEDIRRYLEAAGFPYVIAYSLSEAIQAVHDHLQC